MNPEQIHQLQQAVLIGRLSVVFAALLLLLMVSDLFANRR